MRAAYDDSPSTACQKKTSGQFVETPQRPKTTIAEIHLQLNSSALLHEPPRSGGGFKGRDNRRTGGRRRDAGGADGHERSTWTVELKQRRETHRDTECAREETIDDDITKPATPVSLPDDPAKRRLLKKTHVQSSDVLMAVEINDTDLLHTVKGERRCRG